MLITVERFKSNGTATLSRVNIDGVFYCWGLEDEKREVKVMGETRIPAGEYQLKIRRAGGMNTRYSQKFPSFHKGMIEIANIPNFEAVLIHIGNTEKETAGCLLVGSQYSTANNVFLLMGSTVAYKGFYQKVIGDVLANTAKIKFIDNDGA